MGFMMSLLAGPATGLVGSLLSNVIGGVGGYFKRKSEAEEKKLDRAHELELQKLNMQSRGSEMENERLIAEADMISQNLSASYKHDASYGEASQGIVNVLRLVRPAITILLLVLVAVIYFTVADDAMVTESGEVMTVRERIVLSVVFMAEVAVGWWYADRRMAQK